MYKRVFESNGYNVVNYQLPLDDEWCMIFAFHLHDLEGTMGFAILSETDGNTIKKNHHTFSVSTESKTFSSNELEDYVRDMIFQLKKQPELRLHLLHYPYDPGEFMDIIEQKKYERWI